MTVTSKKNVRVRVTPNARREYVKEGKKEILEIAVRPPAEDGQANERVKELLAEHFSVSVKKVIIVRGIRQSLKSVTIYS